MQAFAVEEWLTKQAHATLQVIRNEISQTSYQKLENHLDSNEIF